jgi:hypothetical protein
MQNRVPNLNGFTALGELSQSFGFDGMRRLDGLLTRQDTIGERLPPPATFLVDVKRNYAVALTVFTASQTMDDGGR